MTEVSQEQKSFKHMEVADQLAAQISSMAEGDRLPSVRNLMREHNASQQTIIRAVETVASRGLLVRRSRSGMYVSRTKPGRKRSASKLIAVSVPDIRSHFGSILVHGIQERALMCGFDTVLWITLNDIDREFAYLADFHQGQVGGLVILATSKSLANPVYLSRIHALRKQNRPMISIDIPVPGFPPETFVGLDNFSMGRLAGRYLFEKGLRRIAYLRKRESLISIERLNGFCAAAGECGVRLSKDDIVFIEYPQGDDVIDTVVGQIRASNVEGVFLSTTTLVPRMLRELYRTKTLPEDNLRVAAVVEEDFADKILDPVFGIIKPGHAVGIEAASRLIDMIEGNEPRVTKSRFEPIALEFLG